MKKLILIITIILALSPLACQKSQMCQYAQAFFTGAQLSIGFFGQYQPVAQGIITTGQSLTTMLCQETAPDKQAALTKQLMSTINELNELGGKAGIK